MKLVHPDVKDSGPFVGPAEIAWCGGVVDSLGTLRLRETPAGGQLPYVVVSTPHLPIANRLATLTGVRVTMVSRDYKRMGCGDHCTDAHLHVQSTTARWSLTGSRAQVFLRSVRPYLFVKAEEADLLLEASENPRGKPATTRKMREMGWTA